MNAKYIFVVAAVAFLVGFFISPWLYPKLFGYRYAEDCAIVAPTEMGAKACLWRYPRYIPSE